MSFPKPITIEVIYDAKLQHITQIASEKVVVSTNCVFIFLLKTIFDCYPVMMKKYPPGSIYMFLNNTAPSEFDILEEGDIVRLGVGPVPVAPISIICPHQTKN